MHLEFSIIRSDVRSPKRYTVDRPEIVLGRASDCDVILAHDVVSAKHAKIAISSGGRFTLTDLGSMNGTLLDGSPIDGPTLLNDDAVITFGNGGPQMKIWSVRNDAAEATNGRPKSPAAGTTKRIFISHSSRDFESAKQIVAGLEAAGVPCWLAPRDIPAGSDYNAGIMDGIKSSQALLFVCSRHSVESDPVTREVERAVSKKVPVIPIRLEIAQLSPSLEYLTSTFQWVDAFPPPVDRHIDTIVGAVMRRLRLAYQAPKPDLNGPPKYVGPYRVLEQLGEGGMGTVYKAEQRTPIHRTVALKVIKLGLSTKELLARFDSERQALARMDNPHVAHVYDAGADDLGRPYFVMEYVPGLPITQFADDNRLSIKQRLGLFCQVCEAIAHAHTKAILHRDVKSSNVLAYIDGGKPVAKVIDFGIAKALTGDRLTDRTFSTERGLVVGTYDAMSPEQAEGSPDIDTRTDVYSLGVLLYELLCGAAPFDNATFSTATDQTIRQIIREVSPPRPATRLLALGEAGRQVAAVRRVQLDALAKELRSELEWIPLMAMRKERDRRYASALELQADVQNYLENRPLKAGPESVAYRVRKYLRRNRAAAISGTVAAILAIAGVTAYIHDIGTEERRTAEANKKAENQSKRAAQFFQDKRAVLDNMLKMFSDEQLKGQPGSQGVRKLFLERAVEQYQSVMAESKHDTGVRIQTGEAYRELGALTKELGDTDNSLKALRKSVEICRALVQSTSGDQRSRAELGETLAQLGQVLYDANRPEEALPPENESAQIFESLAKNEPANIDYQAKLGRALIRRASLVRTDKDRSRADLEQGLKLVRMAVQASPRNANYLLELARATNNEAVDHLDERGVEATLTQYKHAADLIAQSLALNPMSATGHVMRVTFVKNAADMLLRLNKPKEALALLDDTLQPVRRFASENPLVVDGQLAMADILSERARYLQILGRFSSAIRVNEEIVQTDEGLAQRDPRRPDFYIRSFTALRAIFIIENARKHIAEAAVVSDRVINRRDALMARYPSSTVLFEQFVTALSKRRNLETERDQPKSAEEFAQQCVEFFNAHCGPLRPGPSDLAIAQYVDCANSVASSLKEQNHHAEIVRLLEGPIAQGEKLSPSNDNRGSWILALANAAAANAALRETTKGIAGYERAIAEATKDLKAIPYDWYQHSNRIGYLRIVADLYRKQGDLKHEIDALHEHLRERAWLEGQNFDALIAKTESVDESSAAQLRAEVEVFLKKGMRRVTIPVTYEGITEPFFVYVTDAFEPLQDQFRWAKESRGLTIAPEIITSFQRLAQIAREHNVSFKDLCVYALGKTQQSPETDALHEKVVAVRKRVDAAPEDVQIRLELAETRLAWAESLSKKDSDGEATLKTLDEVASDIEGCVSNGMPKLGRLAAVLVRTSLLRGKMKMKAKTYFAAYGEFLAAARSANDAERQAPALSTETALALADCCQQMKRPAEAAQWLLRYATDGNAEARKALALLYGDHPEIEPVLPLRLLDLLRGGAQARANPDMSPSRRSDRFLRAWQRYTANNPTADLTPPRVPLAK